MDIVNRSLVTIYFSKKLIDQMNSLAEFSVEKIALEEVNFEPISMLLPEFDSASGALTYLNKKGKEIFTFMMDSWCQDWSDLLSKLKVESSALQDWFDFEFSPMVVDLDYVPVTKEELVID